MKSPRIRKRPTRQSKANEVQVREELCVTLLKPSHSPIALNEIVLVLVDLDKSKSENRLKMGLNFHDRKFKTVEVF